MSRFGSLIRFYKENNRECRWIRQNKVISYMAQARIEPLVKHAQKGLIKAIHSSLQHDLIRYSGLYNLIDYFCQGSKQAFSGQVSQHLTPHPISLCDASSSPDYLTISFSKEIHLDLLFWLSDSYLDSPFLLSNSEDSDRNYRFAQPLIDYDSMSMAPFQAWEVLFIFLLLVVCSLYQSCCHIWKNMQRFSMTSMTSRPMYFVTQSITAHVIFDIRLFDIVCVALSVPCVNLPDKFLYVLHMYPGFSDIVHTYTINISSKMKKGARGGPLNVIIMSSIFILKAAISYTQSYNHIKVRSIYISKILNALPNKLDNSLMLPLPTACLFLQPTTASLLQIIYLHLHPLKDLLLGVPNLLQLLLQQQHLGLKLVDQTHHAALPLLLLPQQPLPNGLHAIYQGIRRMGGLLGKGLSPSLTFLQLFPDDFLMFPGDAISLAVIGHSMALPLDLLFHLLQSDIIPGYLSFVQGNAFLQFLQLAIDLDLERVHCFGVGIDQSALGCEGKGIGMNGVMVSVVEGAAAGVLGEKGSTHSVELQILKQNYLSIIGDIQRGMDKRREWLYEGEFWRNRDRNGKN